MRRALSSSATGRNSSDQIGRAGFNRAMAIIAGDNAVKYYDETSKF